MVLRILCEARFTFVKNRNCLGGSSATAGYVTYSCGTSAPSRAPVLLTLKEMQRSKISAPPQLGGGG